MKRQPVYFAGRLYFMTDEDRVYALEAATGKWLWQYEREQPESFTIHGNAGVTVYANRLYAGFSAVEAVLECRQVTLMEFHR